MRYLPRYTPEQARRHVVRPGLTGWAQVNGRNALPWDEKFTLDVWYVDHGNLLLDLKILVLTCVRLLRPQGIESQGHATMPEFMGDGHVDAKTLPADTVAVIGGGGHAKVVIDVLRATGQHALAVFDDDPQLQGAKVYGVPVVGPRRLLRDDASRQAIIAIRDNRHRAACAAELRCRWLTVCHPSATVAEGVRLGSGTVVMAGVVIQSDAVVGDHVILNTGVLVDHDCRIGDGVHLAPGCCLTGGVSVGSGAFCGAGSTVLPRVQIGRNATLAAGAVAVHDISEEVTALGVPARPRTASRVAA